MGFSVLNMTCIWSDFKRKIGELIFFQDTLYLIHKNIQEDFSAQVEFYTYILLVMM